MKTICLLCFLFVFPFFSGAQNIAWYPADYPEFSGPGNVKLPSPFAGGLAAPQFSNIDLNGDGIQDLFVFDRSGYKVLTFLNTGSTNNPQYIYSPQYESAFPVMSQYALLVDYNKDGKPDIFTYYEGAIRVYKNITSDTMPKFKLVADPLLFYNLEGTYSPIFTSPTDLPAFADVTGNGTIDVLAFDISGFTIAFFRNMSNNMDSFNLRSENICWGNIMVQDSGNTVHIDTMCWNKIVWPDSSLTPLPSDNDEMLQEPIMMLKKHAGDGTLLALDRDNDGDMDLIIGDELSPNLIYLENGRLQYNYHKDTIVAIDTFFPAPQAKPVDIPRFPAAFYADVNNDGKKDLLVAPFGTTNAQSLGQVWLYTNTGTTEKPVFQFTKNNFLQEQMLDLGKHTSPVFFDFDGTKGNYTLTGEIADVLVLFENYGDAKNPKYRQKAYDFLQLSAKGYINLAPAIGDLTGNGKADLLIGKANGRLDLYRNTSVTGTANFELFKTDFAGIDVGDDSRPFIFDLDGDGLNDLIIGEKNGNINYYRNLGPQSNPTFTLVTDSLGKIRSNYSYYAYDDDNQGNIIDSTLHFDKSGHSSPAIGDIYNNGKLMLLTGSEQGKVFVYEVDAANPEKKWALQDSLFYDLRTSKGMDYHFGSFSAPAIADINGDSLPDLMVGQSRGGLMFFSSRNRPDSFKVSIAEKPQDKKLHIYPNPTRNIVYIKLADNSRPQNYSISVHSITGQKIVFKEAVNAVGVQELPLHNLAKGIYLVKVVADDGSLYTGKIVVE